MSNRAHIAAALIILMGTLCIAPVISASGTPPSLVATTGVGYADLSWQTVPEADRYALYRGSADEMTMIANISAPFTAYHDGDVENGASYLYYVTAWEGDNESAPSNTLSVTIPLEVKNDVILPILAIVLSIIAVQICIVMLLYFSKQKMQLK
jgi:hypothetical protein